MESYESLPNDILKIILFNLNVKDITNYSLTNINLNKLTNNDDFWIDYIEFKYNLEKIFPPSIEIGVNRNKDERIFTLEMLTSLIDELKDRYPKNKCYALYLENSKLIRLINRGNVAQAIISNYDKINKNLNFYSCLYGKNLSILFLGHKCKIHIFDTYGTLQEEKDINSNDKLGNIKINNISIFEYIDTKINL